MIKLIGLNCSQCLFPNDNMSSINGMCRSNCVHVDFVTWKGSLKLPENLWLFKHMDSYLKSLMLNKQELEMSNFSNIQTLNYTKRATVL